MKNVNLALILIFSLFYLSSKSQDDNAVIKEYKDALNAEKGYIITQNGEYKQGYIILSKDLNNSEYVDFLKFIKAAPERYTKNDIKEYGFNEVVYVTTPYKDDIVFMRRMNQNEPYVYYYKSREVTEFYVKKDGELLLLPPEKSELRVFLSEELKNCDISIQNSKLAIYNKQRLNFIFERHSNCDVKRIPFFNYGIYIGAGINNLKLDPSRVFAYYDYDSPKPGIVASQVGNLDYTPKTAIFAGFFADIPLTVNGGKLSFHPELEFRRKSYQFTKSINGEFEFNISYYTANIFARYKSLDKKHVAFIDFGFIYSILDVGNSFYSNTTSNTKYNFDPKLNSSIYGLGLGAGMSFPFSVRNSVDVSLRYSYLISQSKMPTVSNLDLVVGIAF
ncbi:MAG: hypothetical protein PF485_09040 [Bacteroidales bacterium]|jgi:hypothetical protein|nr:hypothetical protein [Bacteroidales bacterium]